MTSKYGIQKLNGGWVVVLKGSGHIMSAFFSTEQQATAVRDQFESGEHSVDKKVEVWVVGKHFVMEAYLGGHQIGFVDSLDMTQYEVVKSITQAALDKRMMKYFNKHGEFPDT
jgi:hypothetical protein